MQIEERSYKTITVEDLKKLKDLALRERIEFFDRKPCYRKAYWDSLIAIALCQGAALHFIDSRTGVKDFDIWYFYIKNYEVTYPYRALKSVDSRLRIWCTSGRCCKRIQRSTSTFDGKNYRY